jgi:hypothetical protein
VGIVHEVGALIPTPMLAEKLVLGAGRLVRWWLKPETEPRSGLGMKLVIDEISDRANKLRDICAMQRDLDVSFFVIRALSSCCHLLARCEAVSFVLS